jgi:hypothetical protein
MASSIRTASESPDHDDGNDAEVRNAASSSIASMKTRGTADEVEHSTGRSEKLRQVDDRALPFELLFLLRSEFFPRRGWRQRPSQVGSGRAGAVDVAATGRSGTAGGVGSGQDGSVVSAALVAGSATGRSRIAEMMIPKTVIVSLPGETNRPPVVQYCVASVDLPIGSSPENGCGVSRGPLALSGSAHSRMGTRRG